MYTHTPDYCEQSERIEEFIGFTAMCILLLLFIIIFTSSSVKGIKITLRKFHKEPSTDRKLHLFDTLVGSFPVVLQASANDNAGQTLRKKQIDFSYFVAIPG